MDKVDYLRKKPNRISSIDLNTNEDLEIRHSPFITPLKKCKSKYINSSYSIFLYPVKIWHMLTSRGTKPTIAS